MRMLHATIIGAAILAGAISTGHAQVDRYGHYTWTGDAKADALDNSQDKGTGDLGRQWSQERQDDKIRSDTFGRGGVYGGAVEHVGAPSDLDR